MKIKKKKAEREAKKKAAAKKGAKKGAKKTPSVTNTPAKAAPIARRDSMAKPSLNKQTSGISAGKTAEKKDTLGASMKSTNANAPAMNKTLSTPAKINVDDQSAISSPELQKTQSDLPANMDQSTPQKAEKHSLTVHMHTIDENGEDDIGMHMVKQSMLEIHSRGDDENGGPNSPSKPVLVVAPEISSWDIADGSFNLEQDDEDFKPMVAE